MENDDIYYVQVGGLLLQSFDASKAEGVISVDLSNNAKYALSYENLSKAKEAALLIGKAVGSSNSRVVKQVAKVIYEDVFDQ